MKRGEEKTDAMMEKIFFSNTCTRGSEERELLIFFKIIYIYIMVLKIHFLIS